MNVILKKIFFYFAKDKKEHNNKTYDNLAEMNLMELYAALRHEVHRVEKSDYNGILSDKRQFFDLKISKIKQIQDSILSRDENALNNPVYKWSLKVVESYPDIINEFTYKLSTSPETFDPSKGDFYLSMIKKRRSCRLWDHSFPVQKLLDLTDNFIEAAIWAPNSGNRQAVRIRPIFENTEKELLKGIKEKHCYTAPLLFFIGVDKNLYGALSTNEECIYLDASAAITQIIHYAENIGLGSCWNHFGLDMIYSRETNIPIYKNFMEMLKIPSNIVPIAILAIGKPLLIPPVPERMPKDSFLI